MAAERHRWVVDAIEEFVASIEVDGGKTLQVPQWLLPDGARDGDALSVHHERPARGTRSVLTIEIDAAATKDAYEKSKAQVAGIKKQSTDPGGDITL
ncbi:MAG TPA: DUF3006 domain-containing protein [Gemmatimonadaceae bacterium]|nr:DUF3006 domain-containing protein [Gemmatimonadaceae bacterium]